MEDRKIADYIASVENSPHWQATAKTKDGHPSVIIRGHEHGRFTDPEHYSVYDGHENLGLMAFNADGIRGLFDSGKLTLVRGTVPELVKSESA